MSPEFHFPIVQLLNYSTPIKQPSERQWAEMREAQLKSLSFLNTAMAGTHDISEWNDTHTVNKEAVNNRLAFAAEMVAYGNKKVVN